MVHDREVGVVFDDMHMIKRSGCGAGRGTREVPRQEVGVAHQARRVLMATYHFLLQEIPHKVKVRVHERCTFSAKAAWNKATHLFHSFLCFSLYEHKYH